LLSDRVKSIYSAGTESRLMDFYNFPGVIYAAHGSKSSQGMGASIDTTPKEAAAAGWAEALDEGHLAGPNLLRHAWPSRTLSLTTHP